MFSFVCVFFKLLFFFFSKLTLTNSNICVLGITHRGLKRGWGMAVARLTTARRQRSGQGHRSFIGPRFVLVTEECRHQGFQLGCFAAPLGHAGSIYLYQLIVCTETLSRDFHRMFSNIGGPRIISRIQQYISIICSKGNAVFESNKCMFGYFPNCIRLIFFILTVHVILSPFGFINPMQFTVYKYFIFLIYRL